MCANYIAVNSLCIMGRLTYSAVLGLLLLQLAYCAKPVFDEGQQWVYEYKSNLLTKNAASDEHIAEWTVTGKLKVQSAKDAVILKLDDLKTSVFNGIRANRDDAKDQVIPVEAQVLSEPFVVHYSNDDGSHKDIHISHQANEPLWSVNMKRAIGSIFQMKEDGKFDKKHTTYEDSIYGACQVVYKVQTVEDKQTIDKIFDYGTCEYVAEPNWGNVRAYGEHISIQGEMERVYHYTKKNGQFVIGDVESSANYTYRNMPDVRSSQHVLQKQEFRVLEQTDIVEPIDVSKNTKKTTVFFEYASDDDESFGRHPEEKKDQMELVKKFVPAFAEFKKQYQRKPLLNYDIHENDSFAEMVDILSELNLDSLDSMAQSIFVGYDFDQILLQNIFVSLIPYVGEDATVKFIKELVKADEINDLLLIKLLATFPIYTTPSIELVTQMEDLMNLNVSNPAVKYAAVMSFASLVSYNHGKAAVSDKIMTSYQQKYMQLYKDADVFEERMAYLLGLINLVTVKADLTVEFIISIACDKTESRHLRALAMHSFAKLTLGEEKEGQMYETFWPIVINRLEHFEVRIAALEMMLSNIYLLDEKSYGNIINSYMGLQTDPLEKHIQHYIITKYLTYKNTYNVINDSILHDLEIMSNHASNAAWATGNYVVRYTDKANNFGEAVFAKLIGSPVTNAINVVELSYFSHAMSLDLGTYTIYFKCEGLLDGIFEKFILDGHENADVAIPKLLELIMKNSYKLKESPDLHIELVLSMDNRALFGITIDQSNIDSYSKNPLFEDLMKLIVSYDAASLPVVNFQYMVSDLGTTIRYENVVSTVTSKDFTDIFFIVAEENSNHTFEYRSTWRNEMRLKSYNPIADMDILTYKTINMEKQVNFPFSINKEKANYALSWKPVKDSFIMVEDHLIGTYVDADIEQYCAKCDSYNELPMGETDVIEDFPDTIPTGITFNVTRSKCTDDRLYGDDKTKMHFSEMFESHRGNTKMFPLAKPLLYYWHTVNYFTYLVNDVFYISLRSIPEIEEPIESTFEYDVNLEDIYNENDPIDGTEVEVSFALTNRKVVNAEQVSYFNASYKYVSASKEENSKSHIEDRQFAQFEAIGNESYKVCINREVLYPDRRPNKYSIIPVEPAKGKTIISWGISNDKTETCPKDKYIKISEIFSATDEQTQQVKETADYKTCKQESIHLKYTPPTKACLAVFEMMSQYDFWKVYADFRHAGGLAEKTSNLEHTNYGVKLFEIERHLDDTVNFTYSKEFVNIFFNTDEYYNIVNEEDVINIAEVFTVTPSDEAYDDHGVEFGISSTCFITPNNIKSFAGKSTPNYESELGKEFVALIECINTTRAGVTVQRLSDKKVSFTLRSDENVLTATVDSDKLKVMLNDKEVKTTEHTEDESFKIYFLADDVIYVTDNILEIYYNTEYVLIKTMSLYQTFTCGACTYEG